MKMRLAAVFLAIAACLTTGAGQASAAAPLIVGGVDADQAYPFVVSLHNVTGKTFCAGSLITPTWIVTAAHCVKGKNPSAITARVGSNDSGQGGEAGQPDNVVVNPDYNAAGAGGDIALIRLSAPATSAPIDLGTVTTPGTPTRLLGWGQTCPTPTCGKLPTMLQQLDTQLVEATYCTAAFDAKAELCTDSPNLTAGSCYGDSGGPEVVKADDKWQLLGVTSRPGNGATTCATSASIYTSVPAYAAWITATITPPPPAPTPTPEPTPAPTPPPAP